MVSPWRTMRVMWERMCLLTRFSRLAEPQPRPTYWVFRSVCFSQATLSNPPTRWALSTVAMASKSVASSVI